MYTGETMSGTLYVVGTPIGNLEDVTPRALAVLTAVAAIAAEDTRQTVKLLNRHQIVTPLVSYHEHNAGRRGPELIARLVEGQDLALVTDAGMPAISDPGQDLVQAAIAAGVAVRVVPGPSAVTAALAVSGVPAERFVFEGFPPREGKARRRLLRDLAAERRAMVFFEGPHRLTRTLVDMAAILGPERTVAVCRELTKIHEEVFRGTLAEAAARFEAVPARGEITIVIGGLPRVRAGDALP